MGRRRLSEVVLWSAVPWSGARHVWAGTRNVVLGVFEIVSLFEAPYAEGYRPLDNPDVWFEPAEQLGELSLRPSESGELWDAQTLLVHADRVFLRRAARYGERERPQDPFDVRGSVLLAAEPARRRSWRARKAVDREWAATFSWRGEILEVRGPWVLLAHLGCLAGWPEPA